METTYNASIEELIDGVGINKLCPDFNGVDTLGEVQGLNIFSHLSGGEKTSAENSLLADVVNFNGVDVLAEMSVNHTNGTANNFAGTGTAISTAVGSGLDVDGNLELTPVVANWKTHDIKATATKLIVKTNIVAGNLSATDLFVKLVQAYKNGASTSTSGQRASITFGAASGSGTGTHGVISGGPSYAGNVGDNGTFYAELSLTPSDPSDQIGSGNLLDTQTGKYYYIISFNVPSGAATKNYKFKIEVEYD